MLTPQALANAGVVLVTLKGKTVDESLYFKGYDTAVERDRAIKEELVHAYCRAADEKVEGAHSRRKAIEKSPRDAKGVNPDMKIIFFAPVFLAGVQFACSRGEKGSSRGRRNFPLR